MDGETDTGRRARAAREATRASRRLELEWVLIPVVIVFVFAVGFGLKLLLG